QKREEIVKIFLNTKMGFLLRSISVAAAALVVATSAVQPSWADGKLEELRAKGVARIAIGNEPPYSQILPDGGVTGAAPEVTIAVLKKMGIAEIEAVVSEYGAMIPGLQANRFDLVAAG